MTALRPTICSWATSWTEASIALAPWSLERFRGGSSVNSFFSSCLGTKLGTFPGGDLLAIAGIEGIARAQILLHQSEVWYL